MLNISLNQSVFLKFCVHVDFIVFPWITDFETKINVLSIKWFSILCP